MEPPALNNRFIIPLPSLDVEPGDSQPAQAMSQPGIVPQVELQPRSLLLDLTEQTQSHGIQSNLSRTN